MISLQENETVITIARKHWFVFAIEAIGIIGATIAGLFVITIVQATLSQTFFEALSVNQLIALTIIPIVVILLISTMTLAVFFTHYYLDAVILTTHRLIDHEQRTLFSRDLVTIPIQNIVDLKAETNGIIQTFFNYGTLSVQTAGANREVVIHGITQPHKIKDLIISATNPLHHQATQQQTTA